MNNVIKILSRRDALELIDSNFPKNSAVISFHDPISKRYKKTAPPIDYSAVCERVFYVPIHDIDIEILPDFGLTFDEYFPEAEKLSEFIFSAVENGCQIICQCEYGQSRSAACAAAIKEFYDRNGIDIFADYRYYPNQMIFNKLLKALKEQSAEQMMDELLINKNMECVKKYDGTYELLSYHPTEEEKIIIPNEISSISNFAFSDCPYMKKVKIPSSVEYINSSAFEGCQALEEAFFEDAEGWYYISESIENEGYIEFENEILQRHLKDANIAAAMLTEAHKNSLYWIKLKSEKPDLLPDPHVY